MSNAFLLSGYCVPSTVPGTKDKAINKSVKVPDLRESLAGKTKFEEEIHKWSFIILFSLVLNV